MADAGPQQLASLSAHIEGLEAAIEGLEADPGAGVSVRRIARSLQVAAQAAGAEEIAAGAGAIQRASETQLAGSVQTFLARVEEILDGEHPDDVHVLIVEDNKTVATANAAYLAGPERTIHIAETSAQAEAFLADRAIDVVVLDLLLPDRDGRDLLVQMREQESTSKLPVIVLSAKDGAVTRAECLAVGADEFLVKPAEPRALRSAVSRLLRHAKGRRNAIRDGLTGLRNRVGMTAELERLRARAAPDAKLAIFVIQLDTHDVVRDELGRDARDHFVLEVASAIDGSLDVGQALGRWETGKLVATLPDASAEEAEAVLRRALARVSAIEGLAKYGVGGAEPTFSGAATTVGIDQDLRDAIEVAEKARYEARAAASAPTGTGELPSRQRRVLLVEDDRVTGTLIHHRLERDGHQVHAFANGEDAFDWASQEDFDLAVLDVKVPGMDGFELLERLRKIKRYADVPIIMLTGMGGEEDVIRGLELGADDYMLKPFSPTELLARARRLLHSRQAGQGAAPARTLDSA